MNYTIQIWLIQLNIVKIQTRKQEETVAKSVEIHLYKRFIIVVECERGCGGERARLLANLFQRRARRMR